MDTPSSTQRLLDGHDEDDDYIDDFRREKATKAPRNGCWTHSIWVLTLTVTLLGITGLLFGDLSGHSHDPTLHQSQDTAQGGQSDVLEHSSENHIFNYDDFPELPSWRPHDEYILSRNWDSTAGPTTREYNWTITDAVFNPDGVFRPMVLINNQFPGPLVQANEGDTLVVQIRNRGVNATAIHFHGMFQNGTNSMDGTVGVTQCPIAPGSDYTYSFTIRGQSGTYWYHAHSSAQASDGLVGPVVVHPRSPLHPVSENSSDRVIVVQDHYHNTTAELLMDYLQPGRENEEPVPDSALINGRGRRSCRDFVGWKCDDSQLAYPEINLVEGQKHRLRIINVGAFAEFNIEVDEHPFFVTEVEGTEVMHDEPIHRLAILPAQRYSIVLEAKNAHSKRHDSSTGKHSAARPSFWLRANMLTTCFTGENPHLDPDTRAIIRYVAADNDDDDEDEDGPDNTPASSLEPTSKKWDDILDAHCRDLDITKLRPVEKISPPPADDYIMLRASFHIGAWRLSRGFFNETTWKPNVTSPLLHRFLDEHMDTTEHPSSSSSQPNEATRHGAGIALASPTFFDPAREFVLSTGTPADDDAIRTVDIAINNFDDGAHPFHLHGHKFFVLTPSLKGAPPATRADLDALLRGEYSDMLANPVRRDTVTVAGYEWVVIRVVLDNPGIWALHCHNAWHAESGMAMQILVRGEEILKRQREGGGLLGGLEREMCKREGVERGVRPDDGIWFGQF